MVLGPCPFQIHTSGIGLLVGWHLKLQLPHAASLAWPLEKKILSTEWMVARTGSVLFLRSSLTLVSLQIREMLCGIHEKHLWKHRMVNVTLQMNCDIITFQGKCLSNALKILSAETTEIIHVSYELLIDSFFKCNCLEKRRFCSITKCTLGTAILETRLLDSTEEMKCLPAGPSTECWWDYVINRRWRKCSCVFLE